MLLKKGQDCENLTVKADAIDLLIANTFDYENLTVKIAKDCGDFTEAIILSPFTVNTGAAYISGGLLVINPSILGFTVFPDGIYTVYIKALRKDTSFDEDETCAFIDCNTACEVSEYIDALLKENPDMEIHMLHFALLGGSNCGCNCESLCAAWDKLQQLLASNGLGTDCTSC